MARKTFLSYKYDEARTTRDKIIKALGNDATYYNGETSESPDLSDVSTNTIKNKLKDMIYDTSVLIVVLSPNMITSEWIDWEIEYSLKCINRKGRQSKMNGVVCVIQNNNGYDWLRTSVSKDDGCSVLKYDSSKIYKIINKNRINQIPKQYACSQCKYVNALTGSYISIVKEEVFLKNPDKYIENAYNKSQNAKNYNITKQID